MSFPISQPLPQKLRKNAPASGRWQAKTCPTIADTRLTVVGDASACHPPDFFSPSAGRGSDYDVSGADYDMPGSDRTRDREGAVASLILLLAAALLHPAAAPAATRPQYGGTVRVGARQSAGTPDPPALRSEE